MSPRARRMYVYRYTTLIGRQFWVVDPNNNGKKPTLDSEYYPSWPLAISVADRKARKARQ